MDSPDNKASFLIYKDFFSNIEHLPDIELGGLFRLLCTYQNQPEWTAKDDETVPAELRIAFNFFKNQFILDDKKYEKRLIANRINALKGGRPKKGNPKNPVGYLGSEAKPKKPDTDTDTATDTGTGTDILNDQENLKRLHVLEIAELVLLDLNERLGLKRGYSCKSDATRNRIQARLNEGFKLEDFITVNKKKCDQWITDPEMAKYLRPETLYSNKFEGYVKELVVKAVSPVTPKFQTADERRREHNRKCFEKSLQEIDQNVHGNSTVSGTMDGGGATGEKAESDSDIIVQFRGELPQGDNGSAEPNLDRKFKHT